LVSPFLKYSDLQTISQAPVIGRGAYPSTHPSPEWGGAGGEVSSDELA
jgi:hypothetical protein